MRASLDSEFEKRTGLDNEDIRISRKSSAISISLHRPMNTHSQSTEKAGDAGTTHCDEREHPLQINTTIRKSDNKQVFFTGPS